MWGDLEIVDFIFSHARGSVDIQMEDEAFKRKNSGDILNSVIPGSTEYCSTNKYIESSCYVSKLAWKSNKDVYMRTNTYSEAEEFKIGWDNVNFKFSVVSQKFLRKY